MSTGPGSLHLDCQALQPELGVLVLPHLEEAARSLELAADFLSLAVIVDDLPGVTEPPAPWLHLVETRRGDRQGWSGVLFCAETHFLRLDLVGASLLPTPEIWDAVALPGEAGPEAATFRELPARRLLHHELLVARDLVRRNLAPAAIPRGVVESFAAAWAVTVDGRLHRLGLPGYTMAERRSTFSRHFSSAGVLLPGHWEIFQSLWDGAVTGWRDVLAVLRHLPGG